MYAIRSYYGVRGQTLIFWGLTPSGHCRPLMYRWGQTRNNFVQHTLYEVIRKWRESVVELDQMLYEDAKKEFRLDSMTGFGIDGDMQIKQKDFEQVRGRFEENDFVKEVLHHIERKTKLGERVINQLQQITIKNQEEKAMRLIIQNNYEELSKWTANYIARKVQLAAPTANKPFVLGLPTGSSPLGVYKELIKLHQNGVVSFKHVVTFNMDEYVGIPKDHPQSYHTFMWENFFNHIDIQEENSYNFV